MRVVTKVSTPPRLSREQVAELAAEGARLHDAYMKRTAGMEVVRSVLLTTC